MKKMFVYLIFILSEIVTSSFAFENEVRKEQQVGDPLILTPLIDQNEIEEARKKSKVNLGGIESYSGYLTANQQFKSSLFFWFFPAKTASLESDLFLWIDGESGRSSLFSLFIENGPFQIDSYQNMTNRELSWNEYNHILYIDSPVGTGFSFTDGGYAQNATQVAKELYIALVQFFKLFPEYKENKFYIAGRWLAGKYLPELANIIKTENNIKTKTKNGEENINLIGLIMGNALSDPVNQIKYGEYLYQLGLINSTEKKIFKDKEFEFSRSIRKRRYYQAYNIFQEMMTACFSLFTKYTMLDDYHYYNFKYRTNILAMLNSRTEKFVTSEATRSAIHVGNISFQSDDKVDYFIKNDTMKSVSKLVSKLLNDYRIYYYSGQSDIIINHPATIEYIETFKYLNNHVTYRTFNKYSGVHSLENGNLFVDLVVGAGHMTTFDKPKYMFYKIKGL